MEENKKKSQLAKQGQVMYIYTSVLLSTHGGDIIWSGPICQQRHLVIEGQHDLFSKPGGWMLVKMMCNYVVIIENFLLLSYLY